MYEPSIKRRAIELFYDENLSPRDIYNILQDEFNFNGTIEIIRYWIRNKDHVLRKIESKTSNESNPSEYEAIGDDPVEEPIWRDEELDELSYEQLQIEYIKLRRSRQKLLDQNRVLRKVNREADRVINATEELLNTILDRIVVRKPVQYEPIAIEPEIERHAIVQLSDLHLNEAVLPTDTGSGNEYNFHVASKRLQKYSQRIKEYLPALGVRKIVLALTGDMFNSSRRRDELLRNQTALAEGFLIGTDIIASFIQDLAQHFNIEVLSIFGNESRLDDEIQSIDFHNNLDYLLHHFLTKMLSEQSNVLFHSIVPGHELLTTINGANILFVHGHNKATADKLILKYSKLGIIIHYVIQGHYHTYTTKDNFGQSGSLVGDNAYTFQRIHYTSRASQNIYLIESEKEDTRPTIVPIPVDLQNASNYPGYPVPNDSIKYAQRTFSQKGFGETILRVVI